MLPPAASGVLLLPGAVASGAVVAMVEVADGADRAVEVALLAAVPDGGWGVRTPPMPTTTTTPTTPTLVVLERPNHRKRCVNPTLRGRSQTTTLRRCVIATNERS